jgi:enoyl-CoA hydratase
VGTDAVLTDVRDRVLVITLNRPDEMNAINGDLARGLIDALARLDQDPDLVAGVLGGNGRGFCAGMDLKAFVAEGTPAGILDLMVNGSTKPLVAAVEGFALAGGLEIALCCDLIVASRNAKFGVPEVGVGLFAAGGGLFRLAARVPYSVAMEMALTGDPITAEVALAHGLVSRVVDKGSALDEALVLAQRIGANAPLAVAASKQVVRAAPGRTEAELWELQAPLFDRVFASEDGQEGPKAFAEKRPPIWSGR